MTDKLEEAIQNLRKEGDRREQKIIELRIAIRKLDVPPALKKALLNILELTRPL